MLIYIIKLSKNIFRKYFSRPGLFILILSFSQTARSLAAIGWIETAGYTTRDHQIYGPALMRIYNDTLWGIHLIWKDEPSRALYNFRSRQTNSFKWSDGTNIFSERVNLGNLGFSPRNRCAFAVGNFFNNNRYIPVYAADSAPGQGNFREYVQTAGFKWSVMALTNYGDVRFACQKEDTLYYRANFDEKRFGFFGSFPTHNITTSRDTLRLSIIWTATIPPNQGVMFARESRNNGSYWYDTVALSRNLPSAMKNTFLGGYGFYDLHHKLHIVTNTYDGNNIYQAELWHCVKDTPPVWSRICSVATQHPKPIGDFALFAGRPSIGQNRQTGDLFVVWEQFDSLNYEPLTGLARAEIWASRSTDNGLGWGEPTCLTVPDNTSKRFPSLAPIVNDTLHITYLVDSIAGFWEQGQGPKTTNPIIYHRVPADSIPVGIKESKENSLTKIKNLSLECMPNPFFRKANIQFSNIPNQELEVNIYDVSGKLIAGYKLLKNSRKFVWNGQNYNQKEVKPGIYFCEIIASRTKAIKKLIKVR